MKRIGFALVALVAVIWIASFAIAQPKPAPVASQPAKAVPTTAPASAPAKAVLVAATKPPVVVIPAATQPAPKISGVDDMTGTTSALTRAIETSNWRVILTAALLFIIWVFRAVGSKFWKFIGTDRGGALLALISGVLVSFINGWATGKTFSITWLIQGIELGVSASGGWVVAKRLISPTDKKEEAAAAKAAADPPKPTDPDPAA